MFRILDTNQDGQVSYPEFQALMKQWSGSQAIEDRSHWAFNLFEHIRRQTKKQKKGISSLFNLRKGEKEIKWYDFLQVIKIDLGC